ncbi:MAG: tetratricopeptide repeat protein [Acidobacteriia bacterium]|nr:tetratricopeptide repeat protein [Terriglobia bacterium]
MLAKAVPEEAYSRAEILRRFGLTERALRGWERQRLLPMSDFYSFSDLIAVRTIVELRRKGFRTGKIAEAVESLRRKLEGVERPLSELRIVSDGKKIAVLMAGQKMDAMTGQILLDFDFTEPGRVKVFPEQRQMANRLKESEAWFQKGLELEEANATLEQVVGVYKKVIELNPGAAGALVNLGTIYYRARRFADAERYYKEAIRADNKYPLAEFNLGNLYDEQGRLAEALEHYQRALALNPVYADAHFNLALLCERSGEMLKAVRHWQTYLKLDRAGPWADIARRQLERLRQNTVIQPR